MELNLKSLSQIKKFKDRTIFHKQENIIFAYDPSSCIPVWELLREH